MTNDLRSYTTIDVAKRLGVSLQTVQRWVDAGHLKAWKTLGGHRRIEAASAEQLFREQQALMGGTPGPASAVDADMDSIGVVVVDDDPFDRELISTLVQQALPTAKVELASNGFQGLVAIGKTRPDIVISDMHMPHMDGFEMLRNLHEGGSTRPRLLVAVSALSAQEMAKRGQLPPGVLLFSKPLDQVAFVEQLRRDEWRKVR